MSAAVMTEKLSAFAVEIMEKLHAINDAAIAINRLAINASIETLHAAGFLDDFEQVIGNNLIVEARLLDVCTENGREKELTALCGACGMSESELSDADGKVVSGAPGGKIAPIFLRATVEKPITPRAVARPDGSLCKMISIVRDKGSGFVSASSCFFPPSGRLTIDSFGIVARQVKAQADLIRKLAGAACEQGEKIGTLAGRELDGDCARELRGCCRAIESELAEIDRTARLVNLLGIRAAIEAAQSTNDKDDFDNILSEHMTIQARLAAELFTHPGITHDQAVLIMQRTGLDEVWITDSTGKVVLTNVPDGENFTFTRTGQTAPYMEILDNPALVVTEPPAVRAFDGKVFKFVGVARKGEAGIVQVGRETQFYGQSTAKGFEIVSRDIKSMSAGLQAAVERAGECVTRIAAAAGTR